MKFIVCFSRENCGDVSNDDLALGRVYEKLADLDDKGLIRINDDSGEDCLYPAGLFESIEVQQRTATRLHELLAA